MTRVLPRSKEPMKKWGVTGVQISRSLTRPCCYCPGCSSFSESYLAQLFWCSALLKFPASWRPVRTERPPSLKETLGGERRCGWWGFLSEPALQRMDTSLRSHKVWTEPFCHPKPLRASPKVSAQLTRPKGDLGSLCLTAAHTESG